MTTGLNFRTDKRFTGLANFPIAFRVEEFVKLIEMDKKGERKQRFVEGLGIHRLGHAENYFAALIL